MCVCVHVPPDIQGYIPLIFFEGVFSFLTICVASFPGIEFTVYQNITMGCGGSY